jgi:hypothetical protein
MLLSPGLITKFLLRIASKDAGFVYQNTFHQMQAIYALRLPKYLSNT